MAHRDEVLMGRRLGQLVGLYALILVLARMGRLIQSGPELPGWILIVIASTVLGAVVWWLVGQTGLAWSPALTLFLVGGAVVFLRVAVPHTLSYGVIPTADTIPALSETMDNALRLLRSGVPPVYPEPGIIALLAILLWSLGGAFASGLITRHLPTMIIPVGIVYLQFAIFDRRQAGLTWMTLSAAGLALAVAAVALDRKERVGRARDGSGRPKAHRSAPAAVAMASMVAAMAVLTATSASGLVSEYGNAPWRSGLSGSGFGAGGVSFDRFVDLRQRLLNPQNTLLFRATLGPGAPPPGELYWRMETLDVFDGVSWRRGGSQIRNYEPGIPIGDQDYSYRGTSTPVLQRVFVSALAGELVPTAGVPTAIHQIDGEDVIPARSFRVGRDATVYYPPGLTPDDNYQVDTEFPLYGDDLGAVAAGDDGGLTPLFAAAAEAGLFPPASPSPPGEVVEPEDLAGYLDLPDELPSELRRIALRQTDGATTDFERAWMLQHWFRDSGDFDYSIEVSTGQGALDLAAWLDDPTSQNFRTGYCEQFAASLAVLGRLLNIPTRVVWGFTPGTTVEVEGIGPVIEVRDTNAHAWVEMWMDGFGWFRFDPTPRGEFQPESITAGFDPVDFVPETAPGGVAAPVEPEIIDNPPGAIDDPGLEGSRNGGVRWWILLFPLAGLLTFSVPIVKRARRRGRLRRIRQGDITAAWDEIVDRLTDMGEPVAPHLTPLEFARATDIALLPLANGYSAAVYGGRNGRATETDLVTVEWWMQRRYEPSQRLRGALNPRSLMRRR